MNVDTIKLRLKVLIISGMAIILILAQLFSNMLQIIFVETGVIPKEWIANENILTTIIFSITAIFFGGIMTVLASKFIVKPMNKMIECISKLADGDYSIRLSEEKKFFLTPVSKSFNKLAKELEKNEFVHSDFINNFSHELKTPINSINGLISLLKKGNLPKSKQIEYLNIIEEEIHRLSSITTNILTLSKLENQSILNNKTEINISEQIRICVLLLEKKWTQKNINLSLDFDEFYVLGNEDMLKQVWINLIDNGIKFADDNGSLNIRINKRTTYVCVEVENSGSTIKEEDIDRIFNKFYQSDTTHTKEGNGIGLSIVKSIINLHEGRIYVESKDNLTCFSIYLPIIDKN